jgi:hypothetical protein
MWTLGSTQLHTFTTVRQHAGNFDVTTEHATCWKLTDVTAEFSICYKPVLPPFFSHVCFGVGVHVIHRCLFLLLFSFLFVSFCVVV